MSELAKLAGRYIQMRITQFIATGHTSAVPAALAKLRRGIGKEPGSMPELWELTLQDLPEALQGSGTEPSNGERAVHTALTLFALHQQGNPIQKSCMSKEGEPLGRAMRRFIQRHPEREAATSRRFMSAVRADSYEELVWHLRGLIQLLRTEALPLDYVSLVQQLCKYQTAASRNQIRLAWGRQFYRKLEDDKQTNDQQTTGGSPVTTNQGE